MIRDALPREAIFALIEDERNRQDNKFGWPNAGLAGEDEHKKNTILGEKSARLLAVTDGQETLVRKYEDALAKVRRSLTATKGGAKAEAEYAAAYQRLVTAGFRPQIRERRR